MLWVPDKVNHLQFFKPSRYLDTCISLQVLLPLAIKNGLSLVPHKWISVSFAASYFENSLLIASSLLCSKRSHIYFHSSSYFPLPSTGKTQEQYQGPVRPHHLFTSLHIIISRKTDKADPWIRLLPPSLIHYLTTAILLEAIWNNITHIKISPRP